MKITDHQLSVLKQAAADGGEIIMSGLDQTEPRPRRDVVDRLVRLGLLQEAASATTGFSIGLHDYFRLTEAGKALLKENTNGHHD